MDEVDGNFVATRFVALTVPVECVYVANDTGRSTRASSPPGGVPIQRSWRSLALAYARVWLPLVAIAIVVLDFARGRLHAAPIVASLAMLGLSALAHRSGRLPEAEKARLRLLGTITGLRIDPSKLRPATREAKRAQLADLMTKGGIPTTPDGILSIVEDIPTPALPLVYGYACYAGDDAEWRNCATVIYERHEESML